MNHSQINRNAAFDAYRPPTLVSVLKGDAGSPSLLYKLAPSGLSAHAYLTATGLSTSSLHTTTVLPSIFASAHTNCLSLLAIANCLCGSPPLAPQHLPISYILSITLL